MSRLSHTILGLIAVGMFVLTQGAQAQIYSEIGSTGTVVHGSFFYNNSGNAIFIDGGNETRITYNVTNPRDLSNPSWTTLQILAVDGGSFSTTNARLVRIPRTASSPETTLCSLISNMDTTVAAVYSCSFSSSLIDFANYYYYVRVTLARQSLSEFPAIYGVRVF